MLAELTKGFGDRTVSSWPALGTQFDRLKMAREMADREPFVLTITNPGPAAGDRQNLQLLVGFSDNA